MQVVGDLFFAASASEVAAYSSKTGEFKRRYKGFKASVTCMAIFSSQNNDSRPNVLIAGTSDYLISSVSVEVRFIILYNSHQVPRYYWEFYYELRITLIYS